MRQVYVDQHLCDNDLSQAHGRRVRESLTTTVVALSRSTPSPSPSVTSPTSPTSSTASSSSSTTTERASCVAESLHILGLLSHPVRPAPTSSSPTPAASTTPSTRLVKERASCARINTSVPLTALIRSFISFFDLRRNVVKETRLFIVKVAWRFRGWRRDRVEQSTRPVGLFG